MTTRLDPLTRRATHVVIIVTAVALATLAASARAQDETGPGIPHTAPRTRPPNYKLPPSARMTEPGKTNAAFGGTVRALASDGSGGWYIAGDFHRVGDSDRRHLAHILSDQTVSTWDPDVDGPVYTLVVSGSRVFIGGAFTHVGRRPRHYVASLDGTSGIADTWQPEANA